MIHVQKQKYHIALFAALLIVAFSAGTACAGPTLRTMFAPLLADPLEPRIAIMPRIDDESLQLDIGTSADLFQSKNGTFAFGIDFGTYSLLLRDDNFKFPVDTIDYLFGASLTWKHPIEKDSFPFSELAARFRISHISSHFEDGHYDEETDTWIDEEKSPFGIPFTYSREFLNLVVALSSEDHRIYLGYQFLYHTIPDEISRHSFQAGAEISTPGNTYLAADYKLLPKWDDKAGKTDGFRGTLNFQAGWRLTGLGLENIRLAYNYFNGMSRHGMYFYDDESFSTVGILIDL